MEGKARLPGETRGEVRLCLKMAECSAFSLRSTFASGFQQENWVQLFMQNEKKWNVIVMVQWTEGANVRA